MAQHGRQEQHRVADGDVASARFSLPQRKAIASDVGLPVADSARETRVRKIVWQ